MIAKLLFSSVLVLLSGPQWTAPPTRDDATESGAEAAAGLTRATAWNSERAAHLLRRAGFGGTPEQVRYLTELGLNKAVDYLIDYGAIPQSDADFVAIKIADPGLVRESMSDASEEAREEARKRLRVLSRRQAEELRAWWLRRMIVTPRPLEEKMTLFWHGHFTTGEREVKLSTPLVVQNEFLREHALGNFRALLIGIGQDPAMLRYLDNASNRKGHPNENFARELMELFTLGEGHYTEKDVTEAARALTGWTVTPGGEFREARRMHDDGVKTILGQTGKFDGEDVIDIILKKDATPRFLARKLLTFFVQEGPPDSLVNALGAKLKHSQYDLREALRSLFKSEAFYSKDVTASQVKSPIELIVGSFRMLEATPLDFQALVLASRAMGQDLFQPPNVKGWDGGREWITTATLTTRYNFAGLLVRGSGAGGIGRFARTAARKISDVVEDIRMDLDDYPGLEVPAAQVVSTPQPPFDAAPLVEKMDVKSPAALVDHFARRLLPVPIDDEQRDELRNVLLGGSVAPDDAELSSWKPTNDRLAALLVVIMSMPEYQLN